MSVEIIQNRASPTMLLPRHLLLTDKNSILLMQFFESDLKLRLNSFHKSIYSGPNPKPNGTSRYSTIGIEPLMLLQKRDQLPNSWAEYGLSMALDQGC